MLSFKHKQILFSTHRKISHLLLDHFFFSSDICESSVKSKLWWFRSEAWKVLGWASWILFINITLSLYKKDQGFKAGLGIDTLQNDILLAYLFIIILRIILLYSPADLRLTSFPNAVIIDMVHHVWLKQTFSSMKYDWGRSLICMKITVQKMLTFPPGQVHSFCQMPESKTSI